MLNTLYKNLKIENQNIIDDLIDNMTGIAKFLPNYFSHKSIQIQLTIFDMNGEKIHIDDFNTDVPQEIISALTKWENKLVTLRYFSLLNIEFSNENVNELEFNDIVEKWSNNNDLHSYDSHKHMDRFVVQGITKEKGIDLSNVLKQINENKEINNKIFDVIKTEKKIISDGLSRFVYKKPGHIISGEIIEPKSTDLDFQKDGRVDNLNINRLNISSLKDEDLFDDINSYNKVKVFLRLSYEIDIPIKNFENDSTKDSTNDYLVKRINLYKYVLNKIEDFKKFIEYLGEKNIKLRHVSSVGYHVSSKSFKAKFGTEKVIFKLDKLKAVKSLSEKRYIKTFESYQRDGNQVFTNVSDGGKFWGTVGAGILPISLSTGRILLPYRSIEVNEPHTYGVWGGKLDDMETDNPKEAAIEEFKEETEYNSEIKLIPAYVYEKKDSSNNVVFTYYNYIGLLKEEFNPVLNWETESYKWVNFEELKNIEPKHFGLKSLIENSEDIIKKYSK